MKAGWQTKKLGDVCRLMTGGTPSRAKPEYFGGDIKWLVSGDIHAKEIFDCDGRITNEGMNSSNTRLLPINSVMIALNGQGKTRGSVALLRTQATCNQSLVCIIPNDSSKLLPEFLYANLHGRYQEIRHLTSDADNDRRGLNMPIIRNIDIPIAPIQEQQRIIAILDEAFEGIATARANAEQNLKNARELFESHLQGVFTQRGEGWVETTLGEVCKFENGDRGKNYPHRSEYVESGVPWINTGHIQPDGSLSMQDMNFITRKKFDSLRSGKIKPGDLVYCLRGATLGKTALVDPYAEGAVASSLVIIRPKNPLGSIFLYFFLTSTHGQSLIKGFENGAAQPNLGAKSVAQYKILLPPISKQNEIVRKISELRAVVQRLEAIYQQKITALDELKKALLHKAFSGEL